MNADGVTRIRVVRTAGQLCHLYIIVTRICTFRNVPVDFFDKSVRRFSDFCNFSKINAGSACLIRIKDFCTGIVHAFADFLKSVPVISL